MGAAAAGALSPAGGGGGAAADVKAAVEAAGVAAGDDGDGGLFAAEVPAAAAAAKLVGFGAGGLVVGPALVAEDVAESTDWGRGAVLFPVVVDFALLLSFATVDTSISPNLS